VHKTRLGFIRRVEDAMTEARHILDTAGGLAGAEQLLSRQLTTVVDRSNSVLTLCTVVLTITGFSGPSMAKVSVMGSVFLALGLILTLSALAVTLLGSLRVRWATGFWVEEDDYSPPPSSSSSSPSRLSTSREVVVTVVATDSAPVPAISPSTATEAAKDIREHMELDAVTRIVKFRDHKVSLFRVALSLLACGLFCYVISFLCFVVNVTPSVVRCDCPSHSSSPSPSSSS
jgi:hypothetical protein